MELYAYDALKKGLIACMASWSAILNLASVVQSNFTVRNHAQNQANPRAPDSPIFCTKLAV